MADDPGFASKRAAMDYLADVLPQATAANPEYRTVKDGTVSRWLTKSVRFGESASGAVSVTMQETYSQTQAGKTTPGTHEAAFSLADVAIKDFTEPGDVTPDGKPSRGVIFACEKPGCVAAVWGDRASQADMTDISLQDDAVRGKILAAFLYLKGVK